MSLMQRVGLKDRQVAATVPTLTTVELAMLDTVMRAFVRGMLDPDICMEATRAMASGDRSMRMIYNVAEEARRTNIEIQKLHDEEAQSDELQFYKSLVQKDLPSHQVASLIASYQASRNARGQSQHRPWPLHVDPQRVPTESSQPQPQQPVRDRTSYQPSAPPPVLASNPSKGNAGRGGFSGSNRRGQHQPIPKDLPDRATSKNPYINGTNTWSFNGMVSCALDVAHPVMDPRVVITRHCQHGNSHT